jgi:hypothetical protein
MRIVTTGMHDSRAYRGVINQVFFLDGEGIHICADGYNRFTLTKFPNYAGSTDILADTAPE